MTDYTKIDTWLQEGDLTETSLLLNQITQLYNLSTDQLTEFTYFRLLKNMQIDLLNQSLSLSDFDSSQVQQLVTIADNSDGIAGQQARNILNYAYGYNYEPSIILPDISGQGLKIAGETQIKESKAKIILAFPNPATDLVTFEYRLAALKANAKIQLIDINGKLIKSITLSETHGFVDWDTKDVRPGLYIYTIGYGRHVMESGQVSIVK